ncbi:unnamed protein product [Ranitomeya imitator]|uniref:FAS1 domain-containing protein n=1 Tax=Ranitomeya imitator TaxID=111125 RepID=A0ABN9L6D3_9NEOB|nr:unnamed protein product [Ranitomeya imitator]
MEGALKIQQNVYIEALARDSLIHKHNFIKNGLLSPVHETRSRCVCHEGEIGDGKNCYGNLLYEMQKLNIDDLKMRKQPGALRLFGEAKFDGFTFLRHGSFYTQNLSQVGSHTLPLSLLGYFHTSVGIRPLELRRAEIPTLALLAPHNGCSGCILRRIRCPIETEAKQLCKVHIIPGQYMARDLTKIGNLWTISGETLEFSQLDFMKSSEPAKTYTFVKKDLPAINGVFHVIDKLITSPAVETIGNPQMTIGDILATTEIFSRFQTMLENCDLPPILHGPGSFTAFVPTNEAVDSLRDGRLIYLFTEAKHKLLELVKYHISSVAAVTVDRLITMPQVMTSSNEVIKINVTENGRILFGNKGIPLMHSDIVASNGIIHVLDGIFIPSTILPILPARCNETVEEVVQTTCSTCDSILPCPDGSTDQGTIDRGCLYEDHGTITKGCARNCSRSRIVSIAMIRNRFSLNTFITAPQDG